MAKENFVEEDKSQSQSKEILADNLHGQVHVTDGVSMVESPTYI